MALIKCSECGNEISDKAKVCINCGYKMQKKEKIHCKECGNEINDKEKACSKCGCPIRKIKFNKIKIIISILLAVILLTVLVCVILNKANTLVCTYYNSNEAGTIEYKVTYKFKNGEVKSLKGYQYAKPNNRQVAESLWKVTNKQQDQYNYYEGLTYRATFSEDYEVTINYSIDAQKAPTMFKSVAGLTGISGINSKLTKNEIREIYEENDFICK